MALYERMLRVTAVPCRHRIHNNRIAVLEACPKRVTAFYNDGSHAKPHALHYRVPERPRASPIG